MTTPEARAKVEIDRLLTAAGWHVCDLKQANIHGARGVAIREFPLEAGQGDADYLLYVDGKAAGIIEAKKRGATLTRVERQTARYSQGSGGRLARLGATTSLHLRSRGDVHRLAGFARAARAEQRPSGLDHLRMKRPPSDHWEPFAQTCLHI